ncbi:hypothetical protein JCM10049v2_006646 [Rhodotorula toruloides]
MSSAGTAGPSEPLLDRIQAAAAAGGSREGDAMLLDELEEALLREAEALKLGDGDVQGTLFDEPFVLLDFLLPLVSASSSARPTSDRAQACLNLVGTLSSPKEVVMGVGQKLAELVSAECAANEDEDSSDGDRDSVDARSSAVQLACLIGLYARALPRIKTEQFRPFTEPACDVILAALSHLAAEGAFQPLDSLDTVSPATDNLAFVVFREVVEFLIAMEHPIVFCQTGHIDTDPLRTLLYETVGRLHSLLSPVDIAAELAGEAYPQMSDRFTRTEEPDVRETWRLAVFATSCLHDDAPRLLYRANDSEAPLVLRLGQFVMALHVLSVEKPRSAMSYQMPAPIGSEFEPSLPLLREVIGHPELRLGEDELLFWLWWVVALRPRQLLSDIMPLETAYSILEILTPLAAQSPSPPNRFLAYTLLDYLISDFDRVYPGSTGHIVEGEAAQMAVLRVLAVECPFANMRDAAVGLVKNVVLAKLDSSKGEESLFLSDTLFASPLGHSLLSAFPPSPSSSSDASPTATPSMSAEEFVEQYHRGVMERLSLVYVLLKRDTANRTHIASPSTLERIQSSLLDPLSSLFDSWSSSSSSSTSLDTATDLELDLMRDLLERVKGAVREVQR